MTHYLLWDKKIHVDPPRCIQNPYTIIGIAKPINGFDIENEFCQVCFKGKGIIKCKNCPKCFFSILPEKINFFGKDYDLIELSKKIIHEKQLGDKKFIAEIDGFSFDVGCPSCQQIHRYEIKEIKII